MTQRRTRRGKEEQYDLKAICGINARLLQWAQMYLRQYMMTRDPNYLSYTLLALQFPMRHSYTLFASEALDTIHAKMLIQSYTITQNFRALEKALRLLSEAEKRYWEKMKFYTLHPAPLPNLDTASFTWTWDAEVDLLLRQIDISAKGIAITLLLGWIGKSLSFLKHPIVRNYLPQILDSVWAEVQGPLWRRAPAAAAKLLQEINRIKRMTRLP